MDLFFVEKKGSCTVLIVDRKTIVYFTLTLSKWEKINQKNSKQMWTQCDIHAIEKSIEVGEKKFIVETSTCFHYVWTSRKYPSKKWKHVLNNNSCEMGEIIWKIQIYLSQEGFCTKCQTNIRNVNLLRENFIKLIFFQTVCWIWVGWSSNHDISS
jgi:hypothetical protein